MRSIQERASTRLPYPNQDWDAHRVYRQPVVLMTYADADFGMDDPKTYYHELLNVSSSNTRGGVGCAADYFRDQSGGLFNLQFDVYGPVKVSQSARVEYGDNDGVEACREVVKKALDSLHVDFTPYDWNNDGEVDQVMIIAASYCGSGGSDIVKGYLWPNTHFFINTGGRINVADNLYANQYTVSAEKWYNETPCGIGTICHEFSHCLGLPDLYPVSGSVFSVVDEWDLMDGGNYTAWGWCPPNYSALEKYLLGWLSFDEIASPCMVSGMTTVAKGGKAYKMVQEGDVFYVLENRQQKGWDQYLPGKGLLIAYVNYDRNIWHSNAVNGSSTTRYRFLHADGMDYDAWDAWIKAKGLTAYVDTEHRLNRRYLSTTAYPMLTDTLEVHECLELPLPLSNIQMSADGLISFSVVASGIHDVKADETLDDTWYDLQGRRLQGRPSRKGIYIHNRNKEAIR